MKPENLKESFEKNMVISLFSQLLRRRDSIYIDGVHFRSGLHLYYGKEQL